jgi:lipoprotein NlpD
MLEMRKMGQLVAYTVAACVLAACASKGPRTPAPVEDRSTGARTPVQSAPVASGEASRGTSGDNTNKPGYYTVRPGDTLIRIALDAGQNWRDIARWNNLDNPNVIEVGQVLRVSPAASVVANASPASAPRAPGAAASAPAANSAAPSAPSAAVASGTPAAPAEDELPWGWPTAVPGAVLATFDDQKNKGLDIGGKAGEPVLAAADGRVVYAGAGLRGYGNLIILKHNNTYLSAYAHNQTLLVKEDQAVRKGQKIAEMGNSDADRVKLHFEIRRQGKPVDPARYLPPMR